MLWREDRAVHADETFAVALEIGADEIPRSPLQNGDDLAGAGYVGPVGFAREADEHDIAGRGVEGVVLGDADVGRRLAFDEVRPDVAGPRAGAAVGPRHRAVRRGGANGVVLADLDAPLLEQGAEAPPEVGVLRRGDAELAGQRLGFERLVALTADGGQDLFFESSHYR